MSIDAHRGSRLKEERERLRLSQAEMGSAVGVRREMWGRYEAGTEPGAGVLTQAFGAGIDVLYVLTGRREPQAPVSPDTTRLNAAEPGGAPVVAYERQTPWATVLAPPTAGALHLKAEVGGVERDYQVVKHITEKVCAGKVLGGSAPVKQPGGPAGPAQTQAGPVAFERAYMAAALGRSDENYLSLTVEGDSMAPALLHGELAVIDTQVARVNVSGIYVLRFDGDLTIKRITKRSDGSLVISSDNPQYARGDEQFTRDQAATLQVIGRMVWPRVR